MLLWNMKYPGIYVDGDSKFFLHASVALSWLYRRVLAGHRVGSEHSREVAQVARALTNINASLALSAEQPLGDLLSGLFLAVV